MSPHSKKKQRLLLSVPSFQSAADQPTRRIAGRLNVSIIVDLSDDNDMLAMIFGFLGPVDIMRA